MEESRMAEDMHELSESEREEFHSLATEIFDEIVAEEKMTDIGTKSAGTEA